MIVNLLSTDEWSTVRERPGWNIKRFKLGGKLGGELLSAGLFEVPPGASTFPYHYHYGDEELLIVLTGRPTLRGPDGERRLAPGDCTIFRRGPEGGHLLRNDDEEAVRLVIVSTRSDLELCVYPDSGKFSAWAGHTRSEDGAPLIDTVALLANANLDYWEDEGDDPAAREKTPFPGSS